MATLRELRWDIEKQLHLLVGELKHQVLYGVAEFCQKEGGEALPSVAATEVDLYDFIVDFLRGEHLQSLEDEGMSCLLTLRDLIDELNAPEKELPSAVEEDPETVTAKSPSASTPTSAKVQVLATCFYPSLLNDESLPLDARQRAERILRNCDGGSIGSYTPISGIKEIQASICKYITKRDGVIPDPDNIYITSGSQMSLIMVLKLLIQSEGSLKTGVLTPVPSHSAFNMAVAAQGGLVVPYYLCEEQGWAVQIEEICRALHMARGRCNPTVLYVINPGSPTGHVQSKDSIAEVIRFAAEEKLFLMVDEVHQDNVYGKGIEFYSYRRVLSEIGLPYSSSVELASFNSVSKSVMGECGLRGGYLEFVNLDPLVIPHIYTFFCTIPCGPLSGQIALDVMIDPPQPTQPSYELYTQEIQFIRRTISNNAQKTLDVLSCLPGISCQPVNGGNFAFPRLHLSQSAIKHAKEKQLEPDLLYCLHLLEDEGLRVGAGCEHGQKDGTYHIRICLAVPEEIMKAVLQRLKSFHLRFIKEFPLS
ncbi:alanine aminotransferase 1 isoform X2 [Tachysurus fulvidraco]|uniref:alanine aminotransferase 1 isoform X2 n=1 Tax=Tachysurus fulvidraco TaxID=1234273 RepID=UPI001FEF2E62|nr:alanine aminotransferase 1 isoform X2 [Tachysurus fulvidraco]